jgi:GDPmannose 4,6-dehydratase
MTRALVTGASGQDGTILCRMLDRDGIEVVGLVKPGSPFTRLRRYVPGIQVIEVDLADTKALGRVVKDVAPTQIYNLGGFTAPGDSWEHQDEVQRINVDAVAALLEAAAALPRPARFFQASSASIFEGVDRSPQTESTEPAPLSPYAQSKAEAMTLVRDARERRGLFACCGILYNHGLGPGLRTCHAPDDAGR